MVTGARIYISLFLMLLLSACALPPTKQAAVSSQTLGISTPATFFYPDAFDRVVVYGPLQVIITNDNTVKMYRIQSTQSLPLSTIATFYVKDRVLYLHAINPPKQFTPYTQVGCLQLSVPQLNALATHNGGKVFVDNLDTPHFILKEDGQGFVELNGKATRLDATLLDQTRLDSRRLEVRTLFINTSGTAQADVQNSQGLSVLTTGKSDVYFYTDPVANADYERQNASTLRMKGIVPDQQPDRTIK
ncbi:MAG: DUF2807 domain-containing protein [Gammaproteobacteria bacterium]|nr:DUF2807 domain-containing protein [Gammaproteobacteria bacterium]